MFVDNLTFEDVLEIRDSLRGILYT